MDKIEWINGTLGPTAYVGNIVLSCYPYRSYNGREWYAKASIGSVGNMCLYRVGQNRKSIDEAKEDAVEIAKNMLIDLVDAARKELSCLGVGEEE